MLTRIRNALSARHPKVDVPASQLKNGYREDPEGRRLHRQLQADRRRHQEIHPYLSEVHARQRAGDLADRARFAARLPRVCRVEGSAAGSGRPGNQYSDHAAGRDDRIVGAQGRRRRRSAVSRLVEARARRKGKRMSRVGKKLIPLPKGVKITVGDRALNGGRAQGQADRSGPGGHYAVAERRRRSSCCATATTRPRCTG